MIALKVALWAADALWRRSAATRHSDGSLLTCESSSGRPLGERTRRDRYTPTIDGRAAR